MAVFNNDNVGDPARVPIDLKIAASTGVRHPPLAMECENVRRAVPSQVFKNCALNFLFRTLSYSGRIYWSGSNLSASAARSSA